MLYSVHICSNARTFLPRSRQLKSPSNWTKWWVWEKNLFFFLSSLIEYDLNHKEDESVCWMGFWWFYFLFLKNFYSCSVTAVLIWNWLISSNHVYIHVKFNKIMSLTILEFLQALTYDGCFLLLCTAHLGRGFKPASILEK